MGEAKSYTYKSINGHHIAYIDEMPFVIDTGTPGSIAFGSKTEISINDTDYQLIPNTNIGINVEELNTLIGEKIEGLIGLDIISKTNGFCLNKTNETAVFSVQENTESLTSVPVDIEYQEGQSFINIPANINGIYVNCIFDTGACISYIDSKLAAKGELTGKKRDYSPTFGGWLDIDTYSSNLSLANAVYNINAAKMTPQMEKLLNTVSFNAILGINDFPWTIFMLDISKQSIFFK